MKENMSNEVVITHYKNQYLMVCFENGRAVEMFLKTPEALEIGDVFIGKVKNIVDNIQAAFLEVSPGVIGYYSLASNSAHLSVRPLNRKLCPGDEILVQVERGSIKSKAPVLTSKIQLSGDSMVFLGNTDFVGVSKKIMSSERREQLKRLGKEFSRAFGTGVIFRTKSDTMTENEIREAYQQLLVEYNNLVSTASCRTCYSKMYAAENNWLKYVHADRPMELRVLTDIPEVYERFHSDAVEGHRWELYTDETYPLVKLKSLETQMERALSKNVWMKSGASLVIEPTETLTAIDVNTSKTELRKKNEEVFYQINIEAAREICRQLRLRNLSGMILVDFINMSSEDYNHRLMSELKKLAKSDPVQLHVIDMTALGLVEITRKRTYRPLHEQVNRKWFHE